MSMWKKKKKNSKEKSCKEERNEKMERCEMLCACAVLVYAREWETKINTSETVIEKCRKRKEILKNFKRFR